MVYPIDEVSDMDDISKTVDHLEDRVDWLIIRNQFKSPRTNMFNGSPLESQLLDLGAKTVHVPTLLTDTRNHLRAKELQFDYGFSPAQALKDSKINWM